MFPLRSASFLILASLALAPSTPGQQAQPRRAQVDALPAWARDLQPRFDQSGRLQRLAGSVRLSAAIGDEERAAEVALEVLAEFGGALATPRTSWHVSAARQVSSLYKVELEQRLFGRRVVDARLDLRLDTEGNLRSLDATGLASEELAPAFPILRAEAAELGRKAPANVAPNGEMGPDVYAYAPEEVFAHATGRLRAAWQVTVVDPGTETTVGGSWRVLVDAASGQTLSVLSLVTGSVSGTTSGRWTLAGSQLGGAPVPTALTALHVTGFDGDDALFRITENSCFDGNSRVSDNGTRIVWTSSCDGDSEVWTSVIDGSGAVKLSDNTSFDGEPVLDEDGSTIVFTSDRDGNKELYKINSDGTGLVRLTSDAGSDHEASIDNAGTFVVFTSDRSGNDDLWRVSTDGTGLAQITTDLDRDHAGALSGDGGMIGFLSNRDGDVELFAHEISSGTTTQITFDDAAQGRPSIDSSGSVLAFASLAESADSGVGAASPGVGAPLGRPRNGGVRSTARPWQVWLATSDGSLVQPLTSGGFGSLSPSISGDGLSVAYIERKKIGNPSLLVEDLFDGSLVSLGEVHPGTRPDLADDALRGTFVRRIDSPEVFTWDFTVGTSLKTTTSPVGLWSLGFADGSAPSISARLRGLWARVKDVASGSRDLRMGLSTSAPSAGNDYLFNPLGAAQFPTAQVTAYQHTTNAHEALGFFLDSPALGLPSPLPIDKPLRVEVNAPGGVRNAFYDGARETARYFAAAGPDAPNTAIDSILYHEYGHFADHMFGGFIRGFPGEHPFAVSEAFGDAAAIYGIGTLLIGDGWSGLGTWVRNYFLPIDSGGSSDRNYECLGCGVDPDFPGVPEGHQHGEALAGFFTDLSFTTPGEAGELTFGALAMNPMSMPDAVEDVFLLGGSAGFCMPCGGDVSMGPLYEPICLAAASHGFECAPKPDGGSKGCFETFCPGMPAEHRSTGTEWLGPTVDGGDMGPCPPIAPDDDGVTINNDPISGELLEISVTVSVDPFLLGSARYKLDPLDEYVPGRLLFLHVYLYVEVMTGVWMDIPVLGSGSGTPAAGNVAIGGIDTIAFDPDLFGGATDTFDFEFLLPDVPGFTAAALRVRLDYGEDGGAIPHPEATGSYAGPCGVARFGEVEDYPFGIAPF